jgi:hypothetical protein
VKASVTAAAAPNITAEATSKDASKVSALKTRDTERLESGQMRLLRLLQDCVRFEVLWAVKLCIVVSGL